MEKKWTKLFQFDRPEGSFELLETERGEPGFLGAEKYSTRPQPSKKDPAEGKISSSLSENEARLRREDLPDPMEEQIATQEARLEALENKIVELTALLEEKGK